MRTEEFYTKGLNLRTWIIYVLTLVYLGWIILLAESFFFPGDFGKPVYYFLAFVPLLAVTIMIVKANRIHIVIKPLLEGKFSVEISGKRYNRMLEIVNEYAFWHYVEKVWTKAGYDTRVYMFVKFRAIDATEVTFSEMIANEKRIPKNWPVKQYNPGEGEGIYEVANLEEMVSFLVELR